MTFFRRISAKLLGSRTETARFSPRAHTRDQVYTYDGLQRLIKMNEGTGTSIPDNLATFRQKWTLDQLGNWDEFDQDDNGNGTYDLEQKRYHNDANEIDVNIGSDDISLQSGGNGTNWANAGYDEAGNMTSFPKPRHLDQRYSPIYDAWNRMTVVFGSGLAIRQKNEYDGLHRRIERHEDTDGDGWLDANDDHRHYYYNDRWQCLAETTESGGAETLDALNAYHPQYIDAVSTRIRSNDGYHFLHDANFNVVAAIDFDVLSKPVVERYHYSPYGEVTVLNGTSDTDGTAWTADPDQVSDIDNEFLYTGRRRDPETGLQYSRERYLHLQLGRWVNRDPVGYLAGDMNLYAYVGGMPTGYVDPMGLFLWGIGPPKLYPAGSPQPKPTPPDRRFPWRPVPSPVDPGGNGPNEVSLCSAGSDVAVPGWPTHNNMEELMDNIDSAVGDGDCLKVLEIHGHGSPEGQRTGPMSGADGGYIDRRSDSCGNDNWLNGENALYFANELGDNGPLCEDGCTIILNGCDTANLPDSWLAGLAAFTGCTVYGTTGKCEIGKCAIDGNSRQKGGIPDPTEPTWPAPKPGWRPFPGWR